MSSNEVICITTTPEKVKLNDRIAIWIVGKVSTLTCAFAFAVLALIGLRDVRTVTTFIQWLSQTFIQLVMLSILSLAGDIAQKALDKVLVFIKQVLLELREMLVYVKELLVGMKEMLARMEEHEILMQAMLESLARIENRNSETLDKLETEVDEILIEEMEESERKIEPH